MKRLAITRAVSSSLGQCELTHQHRVPIDIDTARSQHAAYEESLSRLGCELVRLPEEPDLPDAVFVEDAAVVLDELAILTRPGAASRRSELGSIRDALAPFRPLRAIEAPATLDGGDVLVVGCEIYVGLSSRTNQAAVAQLRLWLEPLDYRVHELRVRGCLHLKSAITLVAQDTLLINPDWIDAPIGRGHRILEIDPHEPYAANGLLIGESVIYPVTFPLTAERLLSQGIRIEPVDLSELAKAEGAVTCCSLVFNQHV